MNTAQNEWETYGPLDFARELGVARETLSRLSTFVDFLVARNRQLNLVSSSTIKDIWRRHILDSAQLATLIPPESLTIVDIGTGAGFPGLVLAILLSHRPGLKIHLIESTKKKASFLQEAAKLTMSPAFVHPERAENLGFITADVVTARAVAPLPELLKLAHPFFHSKTTGLFLKGKGAFDELTLATKSWKLDSTPIPSRSDPSGTILRVTGLSPWRTPPKQS